MKFKYRNYVKPKRKSPFKRKKHISDLHDARSIVFEITLELLVYVPRLVIRLFRAILD